MKLMITMEGQTYKHGLWKHAIYSSLLPTVSSCSEIITKIITLFLKH